MSGFRRELEHLLTTAQQDGLISPDQADQLLMRAGRGTGSRRTINLAAALAWLGGLTVLLGIVLVVAANWQQIPVAVKIGGLLTLMASCHGGGFWIRWTGRPYEKTAEALHFVGAGLFIAGIALVSQVYHIAGRPPDAVLWWLAAILPLAVLLRSASISIMSVFALLVWCHMEGSQPGSPLEMPDSFAPHLAIEAGLGVGLMGIAAAVHRGARQVALALGVCGVGLMTAATFLAGFFRYTAHIDSGGALWLPLAALSAGALGLALGYRHLAPGAKSMRQFLAILAAALLVWFAVAITAEWSLLPVGPRLSFRSFQPQGNQTLLFWSLSAAAWLLWFLLAFWCVAYGARTRRTVFLNVGVAAVALGVMSRFVDLVGTQAQTGMAFVVIGCAMLAIAWGAERWRRRLIAHAEVSLS